MNLIPQGMALHIPSALLPHKHHVAIGLTSWLMLAGMVAFLTVTGRSHKLEAAETTTFVITSPGEIRTTLAPAPAATEDEDIESELVATPETLADDGIPISIVSNKLPESSTSGSYGLYKSGSVQLTNDLAKFSQQLSSYFAENKIHAYITSGVRTGDRQLEIIKERIVSHGMMSTFPALANATVEEPSKWAPAFEWLKSRHIPVDPPADYTRTDGVPMNASSHIRGLAVDLSSGNLSLLRLEIEEFWKWTETHPQAGLQISGILQESRCVHISLAE